MYEELVKIMRQQHRDMTCGNCKTCVTPQAADAIEGLRIENDRLCIENDRLYKAITDLMRTITGLVRELNKQKWVPVTDHTPKYSGYYLVCDTDEHVYTAWFGNTTKHWWTEGVVTHWMPRPELPKKETK